MRSMVERRGGRLLVVVAAIALAACSGAGAGVSGAAQPAAVSGGQDSTTPEAGDTASQVDGAAVGEIMAVLNVESLMDGEPALSGDRIARNAELATDATGLVRFAFATAGADCVLIKSSAVVVVSDGQRLLRQVSGETACDVDSPDGELEFVSMGRVVRMRRGLVRLTATTEGGGTQVLRGTAQAVDPDTGDVVTMGAGDSTGWDTSGALDSAAEPSAPTPDVDKAVAALTTGAGTSSESASDTDADNDDESGSAGGSIDDGSAGTAGNGSGDGAGSGGADGSGEDGSGDDGDGSGQDGGSGAGGGSASGDGGGAGEAGGDTGRDDSGNAGAGSAADVDRDAGADASAP